MRVEIHFTNRPITVPPLALPSREIGACVEFHGIVRETERGVPLTGLHYEAYEPMARRQLESIFAELVALHPIEVVTLIHRLGWVPVSEASLFIRILAAHRSEALAFCRDAIDRLKIDVPIWKRPQNAKSA